MIKSGPDQYILQVKPTDTPPIRRVWLREPSLPGPRWPDGTPLVFSNTPIGHINPESGQYEPPSLLREIEERKVEGYKVGGNSISLIATAHLACKDFEALIAQLPNR